MGEHADDYIDRMINGGFVGARRHRHWQPSPNKTAFREVLHVTKDGREFIIGTMELSHLVNLLYYTERAYNEVHGLPLNDHAYLVKVKNILYINNPVYSAAMKEVAYRRFILQEGSSYELLPDAVSSIIGLPAIKLPKHPDSHTGRYKANNINISNVPKENTMSTTQNMITLLQKDFYTVGAKFAGTNQVYTYKVPNKVKLEKGDHVVTRCGIKGYGVAKIERVDAIPQIDPHANFKYAWIVQKVEAAAYDAQLKLEAELEKELLQVETAHQREALVDKMTKHLPEDSEAAKVFKSIRTKAETLVIGTDYVEATDSGKTDAA